MNQYKKMERVPFFELNGQIEATDAEPLVNALKANLITHLKLADCIMSIETLRPILKEIARPTQTLEILTFKSNILLAETIAMFIEIFETNIHLKEFHFNSWEQPNDWFYLALSKSKMRLTALSIRRHTCVWTDVRPRHQTNLKRLCLFNGLFREDAIRAAEWLANDPKLVSFNFASYHNEVVMRIIASLAYNTHLEDLHVFSSRQILDNVPIPPENYSVISYNHPDDATVQRNKSLAEKRVANMRAAAFALMSIKKLPVRYVDKNMMRLVSKMVMETRKDERWEF